MFMKILYVFSFFFFAITSAAQLNTDIATSDGTHLQRVGNNVYAIIHDDATDQWPHGNTGVIIGRDAVMVIDACYLPSMAREDIRLIRSITKKPVKYLAFTHWHFDHNNGTIAYKDSFPGITIISERESARFIDINNHWWPKLCVADSSDKKRSLAIMEQDLARGKDASGKAYTEKELLQMRTTIVQRRNELKELDGLEVVIPNKTFDGSMQIDLGNRKVVLTDPGKANSPHAVTFYIPDAQILFTGDILVQTPLPYVGMSWPVSWVNVLKRMESIPIKAMVPGHGPVQTDHTYTMQLRQFLEAVLSKTEAMIRQGMTLDQIRNAIDMDDHRKGVWGREEDKEDWKLNLNTIVERAWRGVRGQG
jgi:cyclase